MSNFIIKDKQMLQDKLDLVTQLSEIQIATEIIEKADEDSSKVNEMDIKYKNMKCKLDPVKEESDEFKLIKKFLNTTDNKQWGKPLVLKDLFKVERGGEKERFDTKVGNRKLLWHGSRFTNFGGILSQGLRIAPPEAPASGYLLGKGIYFADRVAKSKNYCRATDEGLLLLCDVACGKQNVLKNHDRNAAKLPKGMDSVFLKRGVQPDPKKEVKQDGYSIPVGPYVGQEGGANELVVYDVNYCQMKYLLRCKF